MIRRPIDRRRVRASHVRSRQECDHREEHHHEQNANSTQPQKVLHVEEGYFSRSKKLTREGKSGQSE